jgi:quercetin dioxygenase-like cupin family protein
MRIALQALALAALAGAPVAAPAEAFDATTFVLPGEVAWSPAPASLPPGAQAAVLYGDPTKNGAFVLRLKFPPGYRVSPHIHPEPEIVTVISGTLLLGLGEIADPGKARPLPAGSFFVLRPGTAHFAFVEQETVLQLNGTGPWAVEYLDPRDDPRKAQR